MSTRSNRPARSRILIGAFSLLYVASTVSAGIVQKYCSSQNTASNSPDISIYQSNGNCQGICSSYAFAVVQGQKCWCSNYAPSDQEPTSSCDVTCPGYPYENCGNEASGLYGYVANAKAPSGTLGSASSTIRSRVSLPQTSSGAPSNQIVSLIQTSQTVANSASVSISSTVSASSSTSSASKTTTASPITTTTVNSVGSIVTVTTTPTLPASTEKLHQTKGINGGVVAGIVIAVVIGLLLVVGAFFFLWFRRYRRHRDDGDLPVSSHAPQRMNSQMSKNGLLGATAVPTFAFRRTTPPQTSGDSGLNNTSPNERRNSRPFLYDQRLNPQALMIHEDISRNSINTIDDGRDYGRRLNVTNPDPDD